MTIVKQGIVPAQNTINWRAYPDKENFNSAKSYLQLLTSPKKAAEIVDRLEDNSEINYSRPGDILRSAGQYPASLNSLERQKVMRDINSKAWMNPPILIRDTRNKRIHIADGYETVAALYFFDPALYMPYYLTAWDSDEERA